jgi:hypothetical protein
MSADTKSWLRVLADVIMAFMVFGVVYWATDQRIELNIGLYLAIMALKTAYDAKEKA